MNFDVGWHHLVDVVQHLENVLGRAAHESAEPDVQVTHRDVLLCGRSIALRVPALNRADRGPGELGLAMCLKKFCSVVDRELVAMLPLGFGRCDDQVVE